MASNIIVNLDTGKSQYNVYECKQNDDLTLEANIFENGIELDITTKEVTINCTKSDGTFVIQSTDIVKEGNKILADLFRDFTRVDGLDKLEIVLIENGKQNTTFDFNILVKPSVIKGAVESENTATILEELGNKIVEAGQAKAETENLIATGNAATKGDIAKVNSSLEQKAEKVYVDTKIGNMGNTRTFKGSCLYSALPTSATVDDYWYVTDRLTNYCWNGSIWVDIGNNINIGDNAISYKKTNFITFIEPKNLFNKTTVVKGSYLGGNVGEIATVKVNTSFNYNIINVNYNETYIVTGTSYYILLLNNDNKILGVKSSPSSDMTNYSFITNYEGVTKVAINYKETSFPTNTFMMAKGSTLPSSYEEYFESYYKINGNSYYASKTDVDKIKNDVALIKPKEVYYVGILRQYTSFTSCIRDLKNNSNPKIIYIDGGEYDIFNEIGGSTYALSIADGKQWYEVSDIIPPNTQVIGLGDVIFNFMPTKEQIGTIASKLLSPVNIRGNSTLENITINADNCRYCIHDETSGDINFTGATKKYRNVICNKYSSGGLGYQQAYASGFDDNMTFEFENCIFNSYALPFSVHNRDTNYPKDSSKIIMKDCILNCGDSDVTSVRFGNINWRQEHIKVFMSNCYMNKKVLIYNESGYGKKNAFELTLKGCSNVTIDITTETNIYIPKVYNI